MVSVIACDGALPISLLCLSQKKRKQQQQHKNGIGIVYHLLKFSENGGWKVNRIRLSGVVPMENSGRGGKSPAEVHYEPQRSGS